MAEILAVLAIMGTLAAAAAPAFVRQIRDGRVQSAAIGFADLVRTARARAMGRGSAVLLRWNNAAALPTPANGSAHLVMRESIQGTTAAGAPLPATGCLTTNWANNAATSQFLGGFDERTSQFSPAQAAFIDLSGSAVPYVELCFSARGRSFVRYDSTSAFAPLAGVPRIRVTNSETGFARQVVIPPNGAARIISRL